MPRPDQPDQPDRPDQPDQHSTESGDAAPGLTARQSEQVRRLLADARHDEPMPADVVARLDDVLAGLRAEQGSVDDPAKDRGNAVSNVAAKGTDTASDRAGGPTGPAAAPVVDLAARRRHRVRRLLVAAAAVVLVGVGVNQAVQHTDVGVTGGSSDSAASDAGGSAARERAGQDRVTQQDRSGLAPGDSGTESSPERSGAASSDGTFRNQLAAVPPQRLRTEHFADDVRRARRLAQGTYAAADRHGAAQESQLAGCTAGDWGRGRLVPVRYAGSRAVLVLRPARGDTQVADLFRCGSSRVLRSVTLAAD